MWTIIVTVRVLSEGKNVCKCNCDGAQLHRAGGDKDLDEIWAPGGLASLAV